MNIAFDDAGRLTFSQDGKSSVTVQPDMAEKIAVALRQTARAAPTREGTFFGEEFSDVQPVGVVSSDNLSFTLIHFYGVNARFTARCSAGQLAVRVEEKRKGEV